MRKDLMPLLFQISEHIAEALNIGNLERLDHLVQLRGFLIHEAIASHPIDLRKWTSLIDTTDALAKWCHRALDQTGTELRELRRKKQQFISYESTYPGMNHP